MYGGAQIFNSQVHLKMEMCASAKREMINIGNCNIAYFRGQCWKSKWWYPSWTFDQEKVKEDFHDFDGNLVVVKKWSVHGWGGS